MNSKNLLLKLFLQYFMHFGRLFWCTPNFYYEDTALFVARSPVILIYEKNICSNRLPRIYPTPSITNQIFFKLEAFDTISIQPPNRLKTHNW